VFHCADIEQRPGTHFTLAELRREYETQLAGYKLQVGLLAAERDRYYQLLVWAMGTPKEVKLINAGPSSIVATDDSTIYIEQHIRQAVELQKAIAAQPEDSETFRKVAKHKAMDVIGGAIQDFAKGKVKEAATVIVDICKDMGPVIVNTAAYAFFRSQLS
jgi:hypothetical protein